VSRDAKNVEDSLLGIGESAELADGAMAKLSKTEIAAIGIMRQLSGSSEDLAKALASVQAKAGKTEGTVQDVADAVRGLADATKGATSAAQDESKALGQNTQENEEAAAAAAKLQAAKERLRRTSKKFGEEVGKQKGLLGEFVDGYNEVSDAVQLFGTRTSIAGGKMLVAGSALLFLTRKLGELTDQYIDSAVTLARFNVEAGAKSKTIYSANASSLAAMRNQLKLTKDQASEFYKELQTGTRTGLFSANELAAAASKLRDAYGGDTTERLREFIGLAESIPSLDADLKVTASMDDTAASIYALAKAGKISTLIEMQGAGLFGGIGDAIESKDTALLNNAQRAVRVQEEIRDFLIGKLMPSIAPDISLVAKGMGVATKGIFQVARIVGGGAMLGSLMSTTASVKRIEYALVVGRHGARIGKMPKGNVSGVSKHLIRKIGPRAARAYKKDGVLGLARYAAHTKRGASLIKGAGVAAPMAGAGIALTHFSKKAYESADKLDEYGQTAEAQKKRESAMAMQWGGTMLKWGAAGAQAGAFFGPFGIAIGGLTGAVAGAVKEIIKAEKTITRQALMAKDMIKAQKKMQQSALSLERHLAALDKEVNSGKMAFSGLQKETAGLEIVVAGMSGSASAFDAGMKMAGESITTRFELISKALERRRHDIARDSTLMSEERRAAMLELRKAELSATVEFVEAIRKMAEMAFESPALKLLAANIQKASQRQQQATVTGSWTGAEAGKEYWERFRRAKDKLEETERSAATARGTLAEKRADLEEKSREKADAAQADIQELPQRALQMLQSRNLDIGTEEGMKDALPVLEAIHETFKKELSALDPVLAQYGKMIAGGVTSEKYKSASEEVKKIMEGQVRAFAEAGKLNEQQTLLLLDYFKSVPGLFSFGDNQARRSIREQQDWEPVRELVESVKAQEGRAYAEMQRRTALLEAMSTVAQAAEPVKARVTASADLTKGMEAIAVEAAQVEADIEAKRVTATTEYVEAMKSLSMETVGAHRVATAKLENLSRTMATWEKLGLGTAKMSEQSDERIKLWKETDATYARFIGHAPAQLQQLNNELKAAIKDEENAVTDVGKSDAKKNIEKIRGRITIIHENTARLGAELLEAGGEVIGVFDATASYVEAELKGPRGQVAAMRRERGEMSMEMARYYSANQQDLDRLAVMSFDAAKKTYDVTLEGIKKALLDAQKVRDEMIATGHGKEAAEQYDKVVEAQMLEEQRALKTLTETKIGLPKAVRDARLEEVAIREEALSAESDYLSYIGAHYSRMLDLQGEMVSMARQKYDIERKLLDDMADHDRNSRGYLSQETKVRQAWYDLQKKSVGLQKDVMEKMLGAVFGQLRSGVGGIVGRDRISSIMGINRSRVYTEAGLPMAAGAAGGGTMQQRSIDRQMAGGSGTAPRRIDAEKNVYRAFKRSGQPLPSYDGGGHTGKRPRSGGVDGKGGRFAVVHPNETVLPDEKIVEQTGSAFDEMMAGVFLKSDTMRLVPKQAGIYRGGQLVDRKDAGIYRNGKLVSSGNSAKAKTEPVVEPAEAIAPRNVNYTEEELADMEQERRLLADIKNEIAARESTRYRRDASGKLTAPSTAIASKSAAPKGIYRGGRLQSPSGTAAAQPAAVTAAMPPAEATSPDIGGEGWTASALDQSREESVKQAYSQERKGNYVQAAAQPASIIDAKGGRSDWSSPVALKKNMSFAPGSGNVKRMGSPSYTMGGSSTGKVKRMGSPSYTMGGSGTGKVKRMDGNIENVREMHAASNAALGWGNHGVPDGNRASVTGARPASGGGQREVPSPSGGTEYAQRPATAYVAGSPGGSDSTTASMTKLSGEIFLRSDNMFIKDQVAKIVIEVLNDRRATDGAGLVSTTT
jgi:hypothetical protein